MVFVECGREFFPSICRFSFFDMAVSKSFRIFALNSFTANNLFVCYCRKYSQEVLFATSKQTISYHIINILKERELSQKSVVKEYLTTAADGKNYNVVFYSLEMIIAVGYRVRGLRGTQFRQCKQTTVLFVTFLLPRRHYGSSSTRLRLVGNEITARRWWHYNLVFRVGKAESRKVDMNGFETQQTDIS